MLPFAKVCSHLVPFSHWVFWYDLVAFCFTKGHWGSWNTGVLYSWLQSRACSLDVRHKCREGNVLFWILKRHINYYLARAWTGEIIIQKDNSVLTRAGCSLEKVTPLRTWWHQLAAKYCPGNEWIGSWVKFPNLLFKKLLFISNLKIVCQNGNFGVSHM